MGSPFLQFTLNGAAIRVADQPANRTLADWLRSTGRTGTKIGCAEGDCGACSVAVGDRDAEGKPVWRAINSCIALLPSMAGREILTVEGLAQGQHLHPAQAAMVEHYGSQCGYCTPGFVMSMFEGCQRADSCEKWQVTDQLAGNLCRCTGYRPIRDAALEVFRDPTRWPTPAEAEIILPDCYQHDQERFYHPTTLAGLLELKAQFPEASLIAGATEIGVEINKKFRPFPQLISIGAVAELLDIRTTPTAWHLGAAVTLTDIEQALAGEFPVFDKMLRVFASRQIRNRATLGGNLVTASPIGDTAPVLLALDASVVLVSLAGERTIPLEAFFTGYRQTALQPDEILQEIIIPRQQVSRADSFKVSKRREMDISIVSAAFSVNLADGLVTQARLAFGGVAAIPIRAKKAEAVLLGKSLEDRAVREMLAAEFSPIDDVRGSATYRRGLIVALWDKFVSGDQSEAQDLPLDFATGTEWAALSPSHSLKHESAVGHVTGRAQYVDDLAVRRGTLTAWPVCSSQAHAKILGADISAALRHPGVAAVLLAGDVPGHNEVGCSRKDEILLADQEVFYHGHLIALVVGASIEACRTAAELVQVRYESLPHLLTIAEAIAADSFHTEPNFMRRGDWQTALDAASHRLDGVFELGGQEHFYLETQAAWAEVDPEGNVLVCSSTQHPSEIQTIVAEVLNLPRNRIVVQAPRMGGGFGGKETQGNTWAALAALASLKTGCPVRIQLDRDLDMRLTGKRHPFRAAFQVGFDNEGHLTALHCELISNGGWSLDLSMPVTDRAMFHLDNAYYIPNLEVSGRVAKTNITSQTAFRGFGGPQGMLVIEEIIDRIARTLGLPAHLVRQRNLYHGSGETNTTHYGEEIGDNRIPAIWHSLLATSDFERRRDAIGQWNTSNTRIKRGLAITPVKFGISFTLTHYNQAGALVLIYQDGTVQVNHGGTEMGQGLHAKILGIVMRELGLPAASIRLMTTATDKVPNTSATAASSGADLNGAAVRDACGQLRERLVQAAAELFNGATDLAFENGHVFSLAAPAASISFQRVAEQAYTRRISLSATGYYKTPGIHWDRAAGKGRPFHYFACGAAVSEVEVDGYTGMSRVRRVDILHDTGDSLNPGIDRGQIEGGFVQGMGWLTREQLKWDATGRLLTSGASTYAIPAFSDAPADFRVSLLPGATQQNVIHGSKAVGEPPLMLAISVREAIREAIAAFGTVSGPVELTSPATGEAVFLAVQKRLADTH